MTEPSGRIPTGEADGAAEEFVLLLPSDLQIIEETVSHLVNRCRVHRFEGSRLLLNLRVGVTEALANAILYGNRKDPEKRVRMTVAVDDLSVVIEVTDEGNGFDPDGVPDPTLPENRWLTGGRGIFLLRQLMDEVDFGEHGNSVRLVLYRVDPRQGTDPS